MYLISILLPKGLNKISGCTFLKNFFFENGTVVSIKNKFVRSFFGRICGSTILFRDILTFSAMERFNMDRS